MTDEKLIRTTQDQPSIEPSPSTNGDVQHHWHNVVKGRSFLKRIGVAGAVLSAGVVLSSHVQATRRSTGTLRKGAAALLRLAAAVESIEAAPMQAKEYERRSDLEQEIRAFEEWQRKP